MLERVMRRFGVNRQDRFPTYYDEVRQALIPRVAARLADDPSVELIDVIAGDLYSLETQAARDGLLDPSAQESRDPYWRYLELLRDNDQLPLAGQLAGKELALARRLILGLPDQVEQSKQVYDQVLALLETKFAAGDFPQAGLLLRLFETTTARRRSNERTLFYEEMLARFGVPRVNRLSASLCKRFRKALSSSSVVEENVLAATRWLSEHAGLRLNVLVRHPECLTDWQKVLEPSESDNKERALNVLVPPRWRAIDTLTDLSLLEAVKLHLEIGAFSTYLSRLMKACYFIVVVTTKTGFEPFIRSYFDWIERHFDFPGGRLLPRLHKMTTLEEQGLDETIDLLCKEYFEERARELVAGFDADTIQDAFAKLVANLRALDPNDVPPGDYDVSGLLVDIMTQMACCGDQTVMFRVHRIC